MPELGRLQEKVEHLWAEGSPGKRTLWQGVFGAARALGDGGGWRAVRAPGRVNLIGEHTDYNGLPVMPMAVCREIVALFRPLDTPDVRITSPSASYQPREFQVSARIEPFGKGDWGNYAKAAVQALAVHAGERAPRGFEAVVAGDIPAGAGLSSSSALVVAMALAFAGSNGLEIPLREMADLMASGEHYVGTQGGGMDQTACLMARAGHALMIEFNPTRAHPIPLPGGYSVIIADSMVKAEKSAGARGLYNLRPAECRMAVALLNRRAGARFGSLADVFQSSGVPMTDAEAHIHPQPFTSAELAAELGMEPEQFRQAFLLQRDGSLLEQPEVGFQLYPRVRHVLTESRRVYESAEAMRAGVAGRLGTLMDESHASCRDDYQISCPELDAMVEIARTAKALGARLTGAGFGGCMVALARTEDAEQVTEALEREYYHEWLPAHRSGLELPARDDRLFATPACEGAQVLE